MKISKINTILFLIIILLPIAVVLLLYTFGHNRYELPIYSQKALTLPPECQNYQDTLTRQQKMATVVGLIPESGPRDFFNQLERVKSAFPDSVETRIFTTNENLNAEKLDIQILDEETMDSYIRCKLMLPYLIPGKYHQDNAYLALFDKQMQLRGYYEANNIEEFDRLITEIGILRSSYE